MSNRTKGAGVSRRHVPQHRKEPTWTVADLSPLSGGLPAKIIVAGVAGATLAIPATSAFASPSSIALRQAPGLTVVGHTAHQGSAASTHTLAAPGANAKPGGQVASQHRAFQRPRAAEQPRSQHSQHSQHSAAQPTTASHAGSAANGSADHGTHPSGQPVVAENPATSAAQGLGLLLEPNGTFMTLAPSATNVHTVPAGSLIIMPDGTMMRPLTGTYTTSYGLITVAQAPGGDASTGGSATGGSASGGSASGGSASGGSATGGSTTSGATAIDPGGPLQTPTATPTRTATMNAPPVPLPMLPPSMQAPSTQPPPTKMPAPAPWDGLGPNPEWGANIPAGTPIPVINASGAAAAGAAVPGAAVPGAAAAGTTGPGMTGPGGTAAGITTPTMIPGAVTPLPAGDAGNAAAGNAAAGNAAAGNAAAAAVAGVRAPAGAATPPAVQIISALAGLTANDNGTVTPTGSVNLAFPGSGIGGSLPLSLPSASPVQPAQPTFPAADPNAVVNDPVFQGLIQSFAQQPSVNQPGPILDPLSNIATAPATPVSAGTQLAANTFGLDGNPVASDVSPLPASSFQALAQNADTPGTPGTGTLSPGTPSVGSPITVAPPQGSILMTQPGFFGNTVTTLNPGTEMTLSDGTKLQVTHDNFLSVTPPNGDTYEIAPGSTYTLPDGSGSQIMVPTVPPLLYQQPGYSDQILTPGTHFSTQDGSTIEVTQDGVLRVTTPQGNQMDYAPGSTYTLPGGGGGTISVLAPPQAMNTDLNPATQIGGTPTAGTQLAANTFDGNGSPVASDASQLPVQLAQNQAATPSLTPNSMTVILPDGTAQTFPLGTSDNLTGPPTFGPGSVIMVPLGTQVPLSSGGSMTIDSPGKLIFPGAPELPTVQGIPAVPTSDNSTGGTTAVAMNTSPPTGNPVTTDAGGAGGATQPPVTQPPVDTTQPPVVVQPPVDTTQPPVTQPPVVQPPVDTTQPPVTQPPVDTTQPPVTQPPVDTTQPPALISSDPTVGADPVVASLGGGSFAGGGSFGGSGGGSG